MMQTLEYAVRFTTPAFLGNAEKQGQWRTPPFKALLRQWWRVVWAAQHGFPRDIDSMRRDEGLLFGNAWLEGRVRKSEVRIRLSRWEQGRQFRSSRRGLTDVIYLGYGPLSSTPGQSRRAIEAGQQATLRIATPASATEDVQSAFALASEYGAVGGRSRNGWGSLAFKPLPDVPDLDADLGMYSREWREALDLDWPHAIGRDECGPLVWQTRTATNCWERPMRDYSRIKQALRSNFSVKDDSGRPGKRHWLAYPVTRSSVRRWDEAKARLPNSLRFKVKPDATDPKKLRGVIFHIPCLPPPDLDPDRPTIKRIWSRVHEHLDQESRLERTSV